MQNDKQRSIWFSGKDRVIPSGNPVPDTLMRIQELWRTESEKVQKRGDLLSAALCFEYQGARYEMAPPIGVQLAWEACLGSVEDLLICAGATDIRYETTYLNTDSTPEKSFHLTGCFSDNHTIMTVLRIEGDCEIEICWPSGGQPRIFVAGTAWRAVCADGKDDWPTPEEVAEILRKKGYKQVAPEDRHLTD